MKRIIGLMIGILLIAVPFTAIAEGYEPLTVKIPVRTNEKMTLSLKGDAEGEYAITGQGEIEVTMELPGTYHYELSQVKGTDPKTTYDSTVYEITVFVEDAEGTLQAAVSADEQGKTEKPTELRFVNRNNDPNVPSTGDESTLWLWILILSVSGAAILALILVPMLIRRKQRQS
jgi:pilin isopeptide linkage protein